MTEDVRFDEAALASLYARISGQDGIDIRDLRDALATQFDQDRSAADVQAFREGRGRWKKLADEVAPVSAYLAVIGATGRVRFPLDDQPPDAWLHLDGAGDPVGIEVTRALARSKVEAARDLRDEPIGRGFVGLPDGSPQKTFDEARGRRRITGTRKGAVAAIETGVSDRLVHKSAAKYDGMILLVLAPLKSLPRQGWRLTEDRLRPLAAKTAFARVVVMDETGTAVSPMMVFDP